MTRVIAIMGSAGSGKSELRKQILRNTDGDYTWLPFAEPLKDMLVQFVVSQGCDPAVAEQMFYGNLKEEPSEYLDGRTPRHAMQTIGTEWRDMMSKTLYSNAWKRTVKKRNFAEVVVDDLRFLHEVDMLVNNFDTLIVKVTRGEDKVGDHPSEKEYLEIEPDITIHNIEGNPERMYEELKGFIRCQPNTKSGSGWI